MKLVSTVIVSAALALAMGGLGVACGPEETYCYDQHTTCAQARIDRAKKEADDKAIEDMARDAQGIADDGGTTSAAN